MALTIKDIAKKAGVSEATVSLAFNDSPLVNANTKAMVLEIAKELNYHPNLIAKSLATRKSNSIGIIIPDINIIFYANVLRVVDILVKQKGYSLVMAMSGNDPKRESEIIREFIAKRCEGVMVIPSILVPSGEPAKYLSEYRRELDRFDIPGVYLTSLYPVENVKYVMGDIEEGTYKLVSHLMGYGHREIVFIGGKEYIPTTSLRRSGYSRAFSEHDLPVKAENLIECENLYFSDAVKAMEKLVRERDDFTAVVAMNDEMAIGVLKVLHNAGIRVPEDVSLVGYDNTNYSAVATVGITTMDSDVERTCGFAIDMLLAIMSKEEIKEKHIRIKPTMIKRQSVGPVTEQKRLVWNGETVTKA